MNLCIIGPKNSKLALKIKIAAERREHVCRRVKLTDICFELKDNVLVATHRKINLDEFDVFIFRTILNTEKEEALALAKYLERKGKVVIENSLANTCLNDFEIIEKLSKAGVLQLNRVRTLGLKAARDILMEFPHPVLVKPLEQSKEKYAASEDWTDSFDIVRTEKSKKFEFVELVNATSFYRVFVIGAQVIGALRKVPMENDQRLNFAAKIKNIKVEVDDQMRDFSLKATKALGYEIASVDIVLKDDKLALLAVDRAPKFHQFNKWNEIKFEDKIVDYVEERLESKVG